MSMQDIQLQKIIEAINKSTGEGIEKHVNGHIREIDVKLDRHSKDDKEYQKKIDDNITWVVRLIIGAVVLGVVAILFK